VDSLPERIPPEVERLLDELQRHGYAIADERHDPDHFGDALRLLERDRTRVLLLRDRGQWFVDVGSAHGGGWFQPVIWKAFLEGSMPPLEAQSFEEQVRFVLEEREAIEVAAAALDEDGLARLRALRAQRAEARRALPPS
jgi:hypothetical protein